MCNDKMILFYGLSLERKMLLAELVDKYDLPRIKEVKEDMVNMSVKDIIDGLMFEIYEKELPKEEVILFYNLNDYEVDNAIKIFNIILGKELILAVITPVSINWKFKELLKHLIDERDWFKLS